MLLELQTEFKAALLSADGIPAGLDARSAARFEVYRSSVTESLVAVLGAAFPTVRDVVGASYFRVAAIAYIRQSPPLRPQLSAYGASFPDHIAGFPGAGNLPYLGDLARLEWLLVECYFAAAPAERVAGSDLAAVPAAEIARLALVAAPSLRLLQSRHAVWQIWQAHRLAPGELAPADLAAIDVAAPCRLRILSDGRRAVPTPLAPADYALVAGLAGGSTIESAAAEAAALDPQFDLAAALIRELAAGSFIGLLKSQD